VRLAVLQPLLSLIVTVSLTLLFLILYGLYIYLYRYKGSYHTNEPKNLESPSSARPLTETLHKEKKDLSQLQEEGSGE
uniref:Neurexin/syndecan/glycophorin C domain-containing protein n=1 Tax=Electrophorus electricus TaxID=8005 RepID=A0AAY5E9F0_ELEEL